MNGCNYPITSDGGEGRDQFKLTPKIGMKTTCIHYNYHCKINPAYLQGWVNTSKCLSKNFISERVYGISAARQ
jgi:hypothetical protein